LPKSRLGVDIEHDFEPKYVVPRAKAKTVKELKDAGKKVGTIYLATDPDREEKRSPGTWPRRSGKRECRSNGWSSMKSQRKRAGSIQTPARSGHAPGRRTAGTPGAGPTGGATNSVRCSGKRSGAVFPQAECNQWR